MVILFRKLVPRFLKRSLKRIIFKFIYYKDYYAFRKMDDSRAKLWYFIKNAQLFDRISKTPFDSHYLYHTAWAARILSKTIPDQHIDVGSCLRFISSISAFIPVSYYDFRPPDLKLSNLNTSHADITMLYFDDASIQSLSCMHVLEHIGLGRYGDPLDPDGDLKGARELGRVLAVGGTLLIALPVSGDPRVEFNAHRIYSYEMVIDMFPDLVLREFSLITDNAIQEGIINNAKPELVNDQSYGCGCFHFIKE